MLSVSRRLAPALATDVPFPFSDEGGFLTGPSSLYMPEIGLMPNGMTNKNSGGQGRQE